MKLFKQFSFFLILPILYCKGQLIPNTFFQNIDQTIRNNNPELNLNITSSQFKSRVYDDQLCLQQFTAFLSGLSNFDIWAIQVADSWGKIPSGILQGNFYELGNFDQCLGISHENDTTGNFKGQYCLAGIAPSQNPNSVQRKSVDNKFGMVEVIAQRPINRAASPSMNVLQFNIGLCIPNTCSPVMITQLIENQTQSQMNFPIALTIEEKNCYESGSEPFSEMEIFTIVFFGLIGLIMILSTIYDVSVLNLNKPKNSILASFSIYSNGEKLFKCNAPKSANVMDCINGIRVLSIVWVIFGHAYMVFIMTPTKNIAVMAEWFKNPYSMLLMSATVSVDSFFLLSGLLVTWSMLRQLDQQKGKINILTLYFHRYLRLTPALAAAILLYATLLKRAAIGPVSATLSFDGNCNKYWWSALLYVQNYVNQSDICLTHSWYLSVDMQLFILSPLIIWPIWRFKSKVIWIIPIVILLSIQCVFTMFMLFTTDGDGWWAIMDKTYFGTHTRMGAWLIGVLLGLIMHNFKGKNQRIPMVIIIIGWIISLGSILAILFGTYPLYQSNHVQTKIESAFYESYSRVSWAISLSWIIFACVNGYGGPVNWFLSWSFWQPLSRLSYSLYIVHFPIQLLMMSMARTSIYFSDANAIHKFWGDFGLSLCAALVWTLAFESPVLILEKLLLHRNPAKEKLTHSNGDVKENLQKV